METTYDLGQKMIESLSKEKVASGYVLQELYLQTSSILHTSMF